ncbi:fimbria/pilus outer membrane usher protein [Stenotrophomonas forensis]|uniref:fimbria/pilus outer membrane usher protein n=1 Tax=Stenotrophomonas forensis TaxID=2871169 RepID=UPI0039C63121
MNRHPTTTTLRQHRLAAAVLVALLPAVAMAAPALEFNSDLLYGSGIDVSRFERDGHAPGIYSADISVNGVIVGRRDVELREVDGRILVCLEPKLLDMLGVDDAKLETARSNREHADLLPLPGARTCEDIARFIPLATANFDGAEQRLEISIPQAYMRSNLHGWVGPERWDQGINALLLNYSLSHTRFESNGRSSDHTSASIDAGLNLGTWRVRHNGYFARSSDSAPNYSAGNTYAQREIRRWNAQLTLGEASTEGDLFNSVGYRGINVSTDPRMLPETLTSYAPVVRGVAQTNARVTVRQRDRVIFETTVSPGPFEIDDLRNMSSGGDLEVEVTEADGRVETFVVPYASLPKLLRKGQQRSSVTVGELRTNGATAPRFVQATVRYGLGSAFTGYGGLLAAEDYRAIVLGGALNTRVGAFSGDVTFSDARLPASVEGFGRRMQGQSYRLAYSRTFTQATSFTLAAYRYSTDGYLDFSDAARMQAELEAGVSRPTISRQRSRLDLTVNHRLPKGSLYLQGSTADYWSDNRRSTNFSLGYNGRLGPASYSISARRTMESSLSGGFKAASTGGYLSVHMPLGRALAAPRLGVTVNSDRYGSGYNGSIDGQFGSDRQGNYNVSLGSNGNGHDIGVGVGYQAPKASVGASWTRSSAGQQLGMSASGSVLAHGQGVAFSQRLGDTVALLHVPGAANAAVGHQRGIKTNKNGFAVVPYLSPYRLNEVSVDPKGLPMDVELKAGSVSTAPTAGAVVKLVIPTATGRSALIEAMDASGLPLPFGLDVHDEAGEVVGVVGQGSRLWVRGVNESGRLYVNAGDEAGRRCAIDYNLAGVAGDELHVSRCVGSVADVAAANDVPGSPGAPN